MQFFILMVEYHDQNNGREAIVDPEQTLRSITSEVRDILASTNRSVVFVKRVDGNFIEDITSDVVAEASQLEAA